MMLSRQTLYVVVLCAAWVGEVLAASSAESRGETLIQGQYHLQLPLGLPDDQFTVPEDNPLAADKVALGRMLFFDGRLSVDGKISCATCHLPQIVFTDGRRRSQGVGGQIGARNAPTLINRAFAKNQFWDGRAMSLEEQVKGPLFSPTEMGLASAEELVRRVAGIAGYRSWFESVFRSEANTENLAKAIASFERTLLSGNARYDKFEAGDEQALSASEQRGLELFRGRARCDQCHSGFNFTDEKYHNIGVGWDKQRIDLGRYSVTTRRQDIGAFKTPTLREVSRTAPYMHDGSMATLEEVVEFYDKGGISNPFLDGEMRRLKLTMEEVLDLYEKEVPVTPPAQSVIKLELTRRDKADLVAFLKALNGEGWQHIKPPGELPQ